MRDRLLISYVDGFGHVLVCLFFGFWSCILIIHGIIYYLLFFWLAICGLIVFVAIRHWLRFACE